MAEVIINTEPKQLPRRWSPEQKAHLSKVMKEKHAAKAANGKPWKPNGNFTGRTGHPMSPETAKRIRELRKTDASVKSIAKQLGVSESSVYKYSMTKPYRRAVKLTPRQAAMAHARQFRHPKANGADAAAIFDGMTKEDAWLHVTLWHDEYVKSRINNVKREIPGADQVLKALGLT